MKYVNECLKCGSSEYILKSVAFSTKEMEGSKSKVLDLFSLSSDLYYLKICKKCGFSEIYSAKIVDEEIEVYRKG